MKTPSLRSKPTSPAGKSARAVAKSHVKGSAAPGKLLRASVKVDSLNIKNAGRISVFKSRELTAAAATTSSFFENDFQTLFNATPDARINLIKQGIEPSALNTLAATMNEPKETILKMLRLSRATLDRKTREHKALPIDESERVLGMAYLIGQVEKMVAESGNPAGFNAAQWVARWLQKPLPALDGQMPAAFMDTMEGQRMVANLLARAQTGAYS